MSMQFTQTVSDALLWGDSGGSRLQALLWLRVWCSLQHAPGWPKDGGVTDSGKNTLYTWNDPVFHYTTRRPKDITISLVLLQHQYVCVKLEEVYSLQSSTKDVLNLDSSTAEKFSRHLIFLLPNCAFKDNKHVGERVPLHNYCDFADDSLTHWTTL